MTKAEKTKIYIIETSAVLFLKHGFEATSLSMLTKATGLTKGAIYGNFKDKNDLGLQVFLYSFKILYSNLEDCLRGESSAEHAIRRFLNFYKNYFDFINKYGSCPLVSFGIQTNSDSIAIKKAVTNAIIEVESLLSGVLARGIDGGEFYLSIPPNVFAKQLFALIQGGVTQSLITEDPKYIKNTATYLDHLFQTSVRRN